MYENDDDSTAFFSMQMYDSDYDQDDNPTSFLQAWMGAALAIGFFAVLAIVGVLAGLAWLALN